MRDTFTRPADPAVLHAWRSGPRWWHVVVALIHDPAVDHRRRVLVEALGDWLLPTTPDQPHVTLWVAGFDAAIELPPDPTVPIVVGGADTFTTAAYLRVAQTRDLTDLRDRVGRRNPPEIRGVPYVPHVTAGRYARRVPLTDVHERLRPLALLDPLHTLATIRHLVVDTRSPTGALRPPPG